MTVFGYVRMEYPYQITHQLLQLVKYDCEKIFVENKNIDEDSELQLVLDGMVSKDILVVPSLAVFGKKIKDLTLLLEDLTQRNIRFISVTEAVDSEMTYTFSKVALILHQIDFKYKSQHTKERLAISKKLGRSLGRPTIDEAVVDEIQRLYSLKKMSYREISQECQVSIGSVHKYLKKDEASRLE